MGEVARAGLSCAPTSMATPTTRCSRAKYKGVVEGRCVMSEFCADDGVVRRSTESVSDDVTPRLVHVRPCTFTTTQ
jgi:hypothetical protein